MLLDFVLKCELHLGATHGCNVRVRTSTTPSTHSLCASCCWTKWPGWVGEEYQFHRGLCGPPHWDASDWCLLLSLMIPLLGGYSYPFLLMEGGVDRHTKWTLSESVHLTSWDNIPFDIQLVHTRRKIWSCCSGTWNMVFRSALPLFVIIMTPSSFWQWTFRSALFIWVIMIRSYH